MKYHYDGAIHFTKTDKGMILILRVYGLIFILDGVTSIAGWSGDESQWDKALDCFYFIIGTIQLIFPEMGLRKYRKMKGMYVHIKEDIIEWKFGKSKGNIRLDEIDSYSFNVGEVVFKRKDGEKITLPMHLIEYKEKFQEFNKVIKEVLKGI